MRRIFWLVVVAAILGTGIWIANGALINASQLKSELRRGVQRATGRELTISGPLHIAMGLAPVITAEGVSLANAPGGSAPTMVSAGSIQARVALLPLLSGQVVLENLVLKNAAVLVETGADGALNWQFRPQRRALFGGTDEAGGGHGGGFDLRHVHVENGTFTWRFGPERAVTATLATADVTAESEDAAIHVTADGTAYGVPFMATVDTGSFSRLQGGPVLALAGTWPLTASLTAGGASLKITGGVNHPDEWRGYSFLVTGYAPDLTPLAPWLPPAAALPLKQINLTARLSDGSNATFRTSAVSLHVGTSDLGAVAPGLLLHEAVFSAPGPGQQTQLSVDGTYQGAPLHIAGTTTQPDVLDPNVPIPLTASADVGSATLTVHGTVPPSPSANGFDLMVDARAPSLADLSSLAGRPLPDVRNVTLSAHVGDAGFRLRGLNLRDFSFGSSIGDLAGNVTLAWAPVLTLNGTLTSHQFDMDAAAAGWSMLAAPAPGAAPPAPAPAPAPATAPTPPVAAPPAAPLLIPDIKLPFGALQGADADLTLSLDRMTFGGENYHDVQAKLTASGGRLVVNPLRMVAPQGVMIGGLTVDASAAPPQVALTFRSPSLSAAKLANLLGSPGGATGQVQVDAQLAATGDTPHALASDLNGHLGVSLVNGSVSDALLQSALGAALQKAGVPPTGGTDSVICFATRIDFTHGQGQVRALALDTPQMARDGDGTIDMANETVALHVRPNVRIGGTGVAAPVSLTGGFDNMNATLDPVLGGRVGITIGGAGPSAASCASKLGLARGGMPGPMPAAARLPTEGPIKKPIDLLRGLFHH